MKKKKKKTKIQQASKNDGDVILRLPNHIIVEIFCKIPTKKLLQFKSVCKSWLSLFSDCEFTQDLFSRTPPCFMMHSNTPSGMFIVDHEKASTPDGVSLRVPHPANADPSWMRDIVGSCDGLLCIRHTLYKRTTTPNFYAFYLLQPITGETLALPRLKNVRKREVLRACGFGFSPITCVYKLLVILHLESDESNKLMVLTVGSKSWRSIGSCKDPGWRPQEMVCLNGSLHWHLHPSCLIGAFNIESEQVQEFQLDSALRESIWLGVLGGCLSLTDYNNGGALTDYNNGGDVVVWLMKEYGVAKSWTKAFDTKAFDIQSSFGLPLKFTEAGELIMTSYARGNFALMTFTPGTSTLEKIEVVGMPRDNVSISLFVPNLVSLKDILLLN